MHAASASRPMALSRGIVSGLVATFLAAALGILLFFQTKDPMMLVFLVQLALLGWTIALIVHVLRHGIPVRVVGDERRGP